MPHLSLSLLGAFEATLDGEPVTAFGADKARALLAFLAVESARLHRRAELAGTFWPNLPEKKAAHNLSQTLVRIRRALREPEAPTDAAPPYSARQPFLLLTPQDVQLNPRSDYQLDVALFSELLQASRHHHHPDAESCAVCMGWLRQAAHLYRGDLLAGFFVQDSVGFEEWRLVQQEALHRQALEAMARLAAYHERRGEYGQVEDWARRQVTLEPWREEAHLQLVRALAQRGQPLAAIEQYETYRRTLAQEFGLQPSAKAAALYDQLQNPNLKSQFSIFNSQISNLPPSGRPISNLQSPISNLQSGERRQVTVLICGRGDLNAGGDPEELDERLALCERHCGAILDRYAGQRVPRHGAECLIYFGYPAAHEDDARRAVHAGLDMAAALKDSDSIRIGIHTGVITASVRRGPGLPDTELVGDVPAVARGCQSLAEPGAVLITAETERLVRGWFHCQALGPRTLLGVAGPVEVYQVLGESGVQDRLDWLAQSRGLTSFVGREPELVRLLAFRDHAAQGQRGAGHGQVVLISGEPGIGKSRLLREFKPSSLHSSFVWLESRCSPYFQNTGLYPILGLLEQLLRFEAGDSPKVKRDKLDEMLAGCDLAHPAASWLLSLLLGLPTDTPAPQTITAEQRERMREVFVALLQKQTAQHPLVVVIEDLHWSDPTTVEWLGRSLDALASVPCLVLLTCRPTFISPWLPRPHLLPLSLGPLSPAQAESMVADVAGGDALPDEVRRRIVKQTDGIPLFVEELTKTVLDLQMLGASETPGALQIPATLRDSLTARLDHAGAAKETAQWAAALGREFSYAVLRAVTPFDERRLQDDLAVLIEAGLVYAQDQAPQVSFSFKHMLVQEAVYASLLKRTRQDYHRHIAETYTSRFPQIAEMQPEVLAQHYANAGLPTQAIDYWLRAGEQATAHGATLEAKTFFDRALELIEPADHERRWRALCGRETVLNVRGERAAQKADLKALLDLAEAFDDDTRRSEAYLRQSHYAGMLGDYGATVPLAEAASAAARRAGNLTLELQALATKTQTLTFFREMATVRQVVEEILAQVHKVVDDSVRAMVLTVAAHYYMESGDLVRSVQLQSQSVQAACRAGKHNLELTINANLGLIYATLGLYAQARTTLETGLARAEVLGDRRLHASYMRHLGYVHWSSGDRDLAQQMEEQAHKELTAIGDAYGEAACQAYLGYILEGVGDLVLAAEHLTQARAGFAKINMDPDRFEAQAVEARVALAQGRREEARQLAIEVWNYIREHGTVGIGSPSQVYMCIADVLEAVDASEPAVSVRDVIEAGYRELVQNADKISNAEWRRSFLENVAENRAMVERWERMSDSN